MECPACQPARVHVNTLRLNNDGCKTHKITSSILRSTDNNPIFLATGKTDIAWILVDPGGEQEEKVIAILEDKGALLPVLSGRVVCDLVGLRFRTFAIWIEQVDLVQAYSFIYCEILFFFKKKKKKKNKIKKKKKKKKKKKSRR